MNINAEVTPEAHDYLVSLLAKQEVPGMAARVYVERGGTQRAETCLAFCPPGEESPGCGMGDIIAGDVKDKLLQIPHVKDGKVDIVFDPPWSYDSLEEEARLELGLI